MRHFSSVTVDDVFGAKNFKEFHDEYGAESGNPNLVSFAPDYERYKQLEKEGNLKGSAMYDEDGNLIAVVSLVFYSIPHFAARLASMETIWCKKEYRNQGIGLQALREAKRLARESDAKGLMIGSRFGSRFAKVLDRIATPMNVVYWMNV